MPLAKREWLAPLARHVAAAAGLGLLLGFLGPFGTYPRFERVERYAFWLTLVFTGYLCALASRHAIASRFEIRRLPLQAAAIALLSAVPQTFIVAWALVLVQPGRLIGPAELVTLFMAVAAVQLIIASAVMLAETKRSPSPASEAGDPGTASPPPIHGRVKAAAGRDILALQAEDHYVRVHTCSGSALVLHRLADAISEVGAIDGLQVHRSWWVASHSVSGTFIRDSRRWLRLANGLEVPVSRARIRDVTARGWPAIDPPTA